MLSEKKILILSSTYNSFVKDQVDIISNFVQKVDISVRYNPLSKISKYIPFLKVGLPFNKEIILNTVNRPCNLDIFLSELYFLPINLFQYKLGENYFQHLDKKLKSSMNYDLIHAHFLWPQGYTGLKFKNKYDIPLILTAHRYDILLGFKNDIWKKKITYVLKNADKVICVSPHYQNLIKELNPSLKTKLIPNGFNDNLFFKRDQFLCKKKLGLPMNKKIILNIGFLSKRKGQIDLVFAIHELVKQRTDIICFIIGEGQLRITLETLVRKLKLVDHVKLIGAKNHEEIPIWINSCDLFVFPSYDESFGVVNVEALACGKPVVSTINGGSEYIINSDNLGYLVNPGDIKSLVEKIDYSLNKKWNEPFILKQAEQYKWNKIIFQILELYKEVIN